MQLFYQCHHATTVNGDQVDKPEDLAPSSAATFCSPSSWNSSVSADSLASFVADVRGFISDAVTKFVDENVRIYDSVFFDMLNTWFFH